MMAVVTFPMDDVKGPTVTISPPWGVAEGQRIEVIGFVRTQWRTMAVWRDDEGRVFDIPVDIIRLLPSTVHEELALQDAGLA